MRTEGLDTVFDDESRTETMVSLPGDGDDEVKWAMEETHRAYERARKQAWRANRSEEMRERERVRSRESMRARRSARRSGNGDAGPSSPTASGSSTVRLLVTVCVDFESRELSKT